MIIFDVLLLTLGLGLIIKFFGKPELNARKLAIVGGWLFWIGVLLGAALIVHRF